MQRKQSNSRLELFGIYCLLGLLAVLLWQWIGEEWETLGDGTHYLKIYHGIQVHEPFAHRIMTPFLARLLPFDASTNFNLVTTAALSLTSGFLALYAFRISQSTSVAALTFLLWCSSFPLIYYGTAMIRADAPMLMLLALVFLLSTSKTPVWALLPLVFLGILSHETMLICVPALWSAKFFGANFTGGVRYSWRALLLLATGSVGFFILYKILNPAPAVTGSYAGKGFGMINDVMKYSGGPVKHLLRIYSSYGPALLYAAAFTAPWKSLSRFLEFWAIMCVAMLATLLATDTLRVMAVVYCLVMYCAARFICSTWAAGLRQIAALLILLQLFYSWMVYGHLRTFEDSRILLISSAATSVIALAATVLALIRGAGIQLPHTSRGPIPFTPHRMDHIHIKNISLGIVTPMANESATAIKFVDTVLREASRYPFRQISLFPVLDNVCTDGTKELLDDYAKTENRLVVVYAPENRCVVDAYMIGYKAALDAGCDWILEMDAGFSHDPASIPAFLEKIPGGFDVIYATRFTLGGKIVDSGFRRKCLSRFGGIVSNLLLGTKLGDMTSGFILYSRSALEQVLAEGVQSKGPFFQTEMKYHARNLRFAEVPITYSGASHHIGKKAMDDAKFHLRRLFRQRLRSMFR